MVAVSALDRGETGIDRPCTLDCCSWAPGGKALNSDLRSKIYEQQTVKHEKTIADQKDKMDRGVKRDCPEGRSGEYSIYACAKKQQYNPQNEEYAGGRFRKERVPLSFNFYNRVMQTRMVAALVGQKSVGMVAQIKDWWMSVIISGYGVWKVRSNYMMNYLQWRNTRTKHQLRLVKWC